MNGLRKVFSDGWKILKEKEMIGMLKAYNEGVYGSRLVRSTADMVD